MENSVLQHWREWGFGASTLVVTTTSLEAAVLF